MLSSHLIEATSVSKGQLGQKRTSFAIGHQLARTPENIKNEPFFENSTQKKSMIPIRMTNDCTEDKTKVTTSRKEVGIQTGGILTVRQRSTQNYIPKGNHQRVSVAQWLASLLAMPEVSGSNLTRLQDFSSKISTLSPK